MFLGIEIGGTKLQLGVGTGRDAELAALLRHDVDAARGAAALLEEIERSATALIQKHPIERIGFGFGGPTRYPPLTLDTTQASLVRVPPETISGQQTGPATPIASTDWAFADCRTVPFPGTPDPTRICVRDAFDPTQVYYLTYTARDPFVLGIGLAAIRDINSFFKYSLQDDFGTQNPLASRIAFVMAHGQSQSGNTVKSFIHLGFNEDEAGRPSQ